MKVLFLAPQPFFQERGTPIAVKLAVEVLAARKRDDIHLLTYHEGEDIQIPHVTQRRSNCFGCVNNVGPGISWKKLVCDIAFTINALKLVWQSRKEQYDLVHAVEESVFIAQIIKLLWKIPYIYDMDSSLALQVTEKWWPLKPFGFFLEWMERRAVRGSAAVVPVCDALAVIADRHGSRDTHILRDISLLNFDDEPTKDEQLKAELGIDATDQMVVYVGNLEHYQGIDLLIEGFAVAAQKSHIGQLVIIGGSPEHIEMYKKKAALTGFGDRIHLVGPRPVSRLSAYLLQADILASPRTRGNNTPMKIYSYLHSGKPIIATNLPTHTQVMDGNVSILCEPDAKSFGAGLLELFESPERRKEVGEAAFALAEKNYTHSVFTDRLNELYDRVSKRVDSGVTSPPSTHQDVKQATG
jgi:glycosyltransferase involved in cell wall biosynthesis